VRVTRSVIRRIDNCILCVCVCVCVDLYLIFGCLNWLCASSFEGCAGRWKIDEWIDYGRGGKVLR